MRKFDWYDAFRQLHTPGFADKTPIGISTFLPRMFCPHCGAMVLEWDLKKDRWAWHKENAKVNKDRDLPMDDVLDEWGQYVRDAARVHISQDRLDLHLAVRSEAESKK